MKKIVLLALTIGMIACTEKNTPDNPGGSSGADTTAVTPTDTTITTTDTISITWNGASAQVNGSHDGVTITSENGFVTVNSTVKDMTYRLSGNGNGQLTVYGTNRHQLILSNLTLACADGPAINNQCKKSCFVVLAGANSLSDGSTYSDSDEDRKAAFFSEGQIIFSGSGTLNITGNYKHALASDDYIQFAESTGSLTFTAANDGIHANDGIYFDGGTFTITAGSDGVQCDSLIVFNAGNLTITAEADGIQSDTASVFINGGTITVTNAGDKGITAFGNINITDGTIRVTSLYKCLKAGKKENNTIVSAGNILISGGDIQAICTGASSQGGGRGGWGGDSSSDTSTPEAIEAKGTITISGGRVYAQSSDDAINATGDLTISGGYVMAYSTGNDGIDANGNMYIKGGVVYAICAGGAEVALDANTEGGKTLYVQGGTIVAIGGLEQGASLSQTCYQATASNSTWYCLSGGSEDFIFKTPSSLSTSTMVVSTGGTTALKSGVTVSGGTAILNNYAYTGASATGGSNISLNTYSGGSGGGPGGGGGHGGGGGRPGGW